LTGLQIRIQAIDVVTGVPIGTGIRLTLLGFLISDPYNTVLRLTPEVFWAGGAAGGKELLRRLTV
jgi:hypothetical protein